MITLEMLMDRKDEIRKAELARLAANAEKEFPKILKYLFKNPYKYASTNNPVTKRKAELFGLVVDSDWDISIPNRKENA